MVDFETFLDIVQLCASVSDLGREVGAGFSGPERVSEQLGHLNDRLQTLNSFLGKVRGQPGSPDKLLTNKFPQWSSLEKTLKESKVLLEYYRSFFLNPESPIARRVRLAGTPDAHEIDSLQQRVGKLHTELEQWWIGSLTDMDSFSARLRPRRNENYHSIKLCDPRTRDDKYEPAIEPSTVISHESSFSYSKSPISRAFLKLHTRTSSTGLPLY
ncbi:hypothetical protein F4808DRAFT_455948 [Astrocystis sublimbata]|nr:hypothetical protein F4808DRAFT_455948 [Astrocystis sublimbata]